MKHRFLLITLFAAIGNLFSQIDINSASFTTSQDFAALANTGTGNTWADNSTIANWYTNKTAYNAGTGSSNAGAMYSFGSSAATDRALGSLGSTGNATCHFGVRLKNNTTAALTSISIEYVGEQWRRGTSTVDKLTFAYTVSASAITTITTGTYTANTNLDFTPPNTTSPEGLLNGNLPANQTAIAYTLAVSVPVGSEIMLRWTDTNSTGNDDGVSMDDFEITAIALPIELTKFVAAQSTTGSLLNWQTATESNTRHFGIERSADTQNWETIAQVAAAGTSRETKNYSFTDESPLPISYYRLRSVDFDGESQLSAIERVERTGSGKTPTVLPTMVEGEAALLFDSETERETALLIYDITGRAVFAQNVFFEKGENRIQLSLGDLPAGQYLVKIAGSGTPASRFVKI